MEQKVAFAGRLGREVEAMQKNWTDVQKLIAQCVPYESQSKLPVIEEAKDTESLVPGWEAKLEEMINSQSAIHQHLVVDFNQHRTKHIGKKIVWTSGAANEIKAATLKGIELGSSVVNGNGEIFTMDADGGLQLSRTDDYNRRAKSHLMAQGHCQKAAPLPRKDFATCTSAGWKITNRREGEEVAGEDGSDTECAAWVEDISDLGALAVTLLGGSLFGYTFQKPDFAGIFVGKYPLRYVFPEKARAGQANWPLYAFEEFKFSETDAPFVRGDPDAGPAHQISSIEFELTFYPSDRKPNMLEVIIEATVRAGHTRRRSAFRAQQEMESTIVQQ